MKKVFFGLISVLIFFGFGFSQSQKQQAEKIITAGLALEVTFHQDRPPAFIEYFENKSTFTKAWYGFFKRNLNFQRPKGLLPVRAVNIVPVLDGNTVKIEVSVFTGKTGHENEEKIGTYFLRENEKVIAKDLVDFGIEPFEFSLVWFKPQKSSLPTIVNYTNSLKVAKIEPTGSIFPVYSVQFYNTSEKTILAYHSETRVDNRLITSFMPQGKCGSGLIESGKFYETKIQNPLQYVKLADGELPQIYKNQTLYLNSIIFADGSYEGDANFAARFLGFTVGRKFFFKELISLIEKFETVDSFTNQINNLEIEVDEKLLATVSNKFSLPIPKTSVVIAINGQKLNFKKDFEKIRNQKPDEVRAWLNKSKLEYQTWLERLP